MVSHLFFYQLVLIALVWLCLMLHWAWPSDRATTPPTPLLRKRSRESKPFAGRIGSTGLPDQHRFHRAA